MSIFLLTMCEAPRVRDALIGGPLEGVERWFDMMITSFYCGKEEKDQTHTN